LIDKDGNKTENGMTGTLNASWPGETWKTGGASTWLGGTYDAQTGLAYFGTGNSTDRSTDSACRATRCSPFSRCGCNLHSQPYKTTGLGRLSYPSNLATRLSMYSLI
jgi:hypothetical protein